MCFLTGVMYNWDVYFFLLPGVLGAFRLLLCGDCLFFYERHYVRPIGNRSSSFRSPGPDRLPFNGLVSNNFRLNRRFFMDGFPGNM